MTNLELLRAFARYKTHPGYVWAAVMADGELLCVTCVRENYRVIVRSTKTPEAARTDTQWECIGLTHSGEADSGEIEHCAHCNKVLWEIEHD